MIEGRFHDRATGRALEARVRVLASTGEAIAPEAALRKVGPGESFFYADGRFTVDAPRGPAEIVVERGTEYRPLRVAVDVQGRGPIAIDLPLERWINLPEEGWYAGNAHVHYDETEGRALERLRLDPRVEDLPVFIASVLQRGDLRYASNAFPIGRHPLSDSDHVIDIGEETRHNDEPWHIGLGHLMLINLRTVVEPISRGLLVDASSPDHPPLVDACDDAHAQGGVTLWCHNGQGMEAPVAAILGRLDGINLFDPFWMDPEYEIWYRLLDCGLRLPVATGSDWFVCSANRVYVEAADGSYDGWLDGLRAGRTFITNGPVLRLTVAGHGPRREAIATRSRTLPVSVEWSSNRPLDHVEIIRDGEVVATAPDPCGTRGRLTVSIPVGDATWLAARCSGRSRDSYGHATWAHTSPVHLADRTGGPRARAAATIFVQGIDESLAWIRARARFDDEGQRSRMLELFGEARARFGDLAQDRDLVRRPGARS